MSMTDVAFQKCINPDCGAQFDCETRIFCPVKSNYCINPTGLKFRIINGAIQFESEPWTGHIDDTGSKNTTRVDEAAEWLKEKLQNGERLSSTLFDEGKEGCEIIFW